MNTDQIISDNNLTCTEVEFDTFIASVDTSSVQADIDASVSTAYPFTTQHNGVTIENPANGDLYYTFNINGVMYLQNISPFVGGLNPITTDNAAEIMGYHKEQVATQMIDSFKFNATIENFKAVA